VDLIERRTDAPHRHPWETARVEAIRSIVARLPLERPRVLELGCGDAFVLGALQRSFSFSESLAYDLHMTEELARALAESLPEVHFMRSLQELGDKKADLVLLLDVLEHIENPVDYLRRVVTERLSAEAWIVVTVPAFQSLFSEHDRRLRHFRRYSRAEIADVIKDAGFEVSDSGYLFASLLAPRALALLGEKIFTPRPDDGPGVGGWHGSPFLTRALHRALCWDNALSLAAHRQGLDLPGLSTWVTCRKS
jgi:trans-aconitate methyltransferase